MRASRQEQTGTAGANEVAADFERIGWGVARNSEHDLGTDLFLMARDDRLFDLGMVVGAQVKSGPSFFEEKMRDAEGEVIGWWFRESDRSHFDAWLSHRLPHLIVLHDLDERVSYWAAITEDTVEYTGKGAKVLVYRANVVDPANAAALLAVAAGTGADATWEGSAWAGAVVSPTHQLRHALLVPRMVAPHPNRGMTVPLTAAQVIAMLVQVRLRDVVRPDEESGAYIPNLAALEAGADWEWRFAAALRQYLKTGDPGVLRGLASAELAPHEQAAATVTYAAALMENGRAGDALQTLDELLARDELDQVDHAWVRLQHTRALSELGRRQQARDAAINLIGLGQLVPGDVTAAAVGGAAANTLLAVSDWDAEDFSGSMSAADTTASWWRNQVTGWGLSAQTEKAFRAWTGDSTVRLAMADETWQYLRSASLIAGLLGDQTAWRHTTHDLARYLLTDQEYGADPDLVAVALTALRRCGNHKELRLAVRRVINNGPAAAAREAALEIEPSDSTLTSAHADLIMLVEAGDLLPTDHAGRLAHWARQTLRDPEHYALRIQPTFDLLPTLVDVLTALADVVGPDLQDQLAEYVLGLPEQTGQHITNAVAKLVRRLPAAVWTPERAQRAANRADTSHQRLAFALLGAAAARLSQVRDRLVEDARGGSVAALAALGDVTKLDADLVEALVAGLGAQLEARTRNSVRGIYAHGGADLGHALTVLNVWHPQHANWDPIYELLGSTRSGEYLCGALAVLATRAAVLPDAVAERLIPLAATIAGGPEPIPGLIDNTDPRPSARRLQAVLEHRAGGRWEGHLAELLRADVRGRTAAVLVAASTGGQLGLGVLVALASDPEPGVRASAARVVAERAVADTSARAQLPTLIADRGVLVAQAISDAAADHPQLLAFGELRPLADHISCRVRSIFERHRSETKDART